MCVECAARIVTWLLGALHLHALVAHDACVDVVGVCGLCAVARITRACKVTLLRRRDVAANKTIARLRGVYQKLRRSRSHILRLNGEIQAAHESLAVMSIDRHGPGHRYLSPAGVLAVALRRNLSNVEWGDLGCSTG